MKKPPRRTNFRWAFENAMCRAYIETQLPGIWRQIKHLAKERYPDERKTRRTEVRRQIEDLIKVIV
jgi:hypothetical protein